jgi:uncharacterized damage-inducible protein DinB
LKNFLPELFDYHLHFNDQIIHLFEYHAEIPLDRAKFLFCHSVNAHQIWNARILTHSEVGVHATHGLEMCKAMNRENFEKSFQILEERDLEEIITYQNTQGQEFQNSLQEILFHVCNHFTYHRGQIMSELREQGIEPLITDFIVYKRS